jgi:hypothetical protein
MGQRHLISNGYASTWLRHAMDAGDLTEEPLQIALAYRSMRKAS